VKTTFDLPETLLREAKAAAAQQGRPLRDFVAEAMADKLAAKPPTEKPWMKYCGALKHLRKENRRIEKIIEKEFETIDLDEWK